MATTGAVLGVIRACRPTFQSAMERVAFAIHAIFLAAGYSIVAVGAAAHANVQDTPDGIIEESEVGLEGWNALEGAYAFRCRGVEQSGLCKSATLKLMVMADHLMIDVATADAEALHHLEIRANDYAKEGEICGNYARQYSDLGGLIQQINDSVLAKISPAATMVVPNDPDSTSPTLFYMFPPLFMGINSDLFPRGGGGISAPRREHGSDGMLIGPNDTRWHQPTGSAQQYIPDLDELNVLPNVRYDPIGPPGVLDIDDRNASRPPERHPDLEHF